MQPSFFALPCLCKEQTFAFAAQHELVADEKLFVREVSELTGKCVYAANAGMTLDLSKEPY